jgi:predicted metal-dependent RNase
VQHQQLADIARDLDMTYYEAHNVLGRAREGLRTSWKDQS